MKINCVLLKNRKFQNIIINKHNYNFIIFSGKDDSRHNV